MLLRIKRTVAMLIAFGCLASIAQVAEAYVLYQDNFDGGAVPIHGVAPDVNNFNGTSTWTAGSIFLADGTINFVDVNSEGGMSLPFEPQDGAVYTLTATVNNQGPGWIAVGFAQNGTANSGSSDGVLARHSNEMIGYLWGLTRDRADQPDQQFFRGGGTGTPLASASGELVSPLSDVTIKVVLNTLNASAWSYEVFYNSNSVGTETLDATVTTTLRNNINFVGFSKDTANIADPDTPANIISFLLETSLTPGDVDGDGLVDMDDFEIIRANLFNTGASRAQGDLTGGGIVDFADFRQWKSNAGAGFANVSLFGVPEPSSLLLATLVGSLVGCVGRFRRRMSS